MGSRDGRCFGTRSSTLSSLLPFHIYIFFSCRHFTKCRPSDISCTSVMDFLKTFCIHLNINSKCQVCVSVLQNQRSVASFVILRQHSTITRREIHQRAGRDETCPQPLWCSMQHSPETCWESWAWLVLLLDQRTSCSAAAIIITNAVALCTCVELTAECCKFTSIFCERNSGKCRKTITGVELMRKAYQK